MDKTHQILERAKKALAAWKADLDNDMASLKKATDEGMVSTWMRWHAESLITNEMGVNEWTGIVAGIEKVIAEGKTSDVILDYLRGHRDGRIEYILRSSRAHSSSPMANLVEDIGFDVMKKVVGVNILDENSLQGILTTVK